MYQNSADSRRALRKSLLLFWDQNTMLGRVGEDTLGEEIKKDPKCGTRE